MSLIDIDKITALQQSRTASWHNQEPNITQSDLYQFVEENHLNNFQLWHEEDKARRDDMGADYVYRAKRNIDRHNQLRNNCMERIDEWLFHHIKPKTAGCPVHSETPGMMIDRLSILALKEYHMRLQTERNDTTGEHKAQCEQKLSVIIEQRAQLTECLKQVIDEVISGDRTFRVYHQFKMYNDPKLNPQLYKNA